jgi:gas vesicle protein
MKKIYYFVVVAMLSMTMIASGGNAEKKAEKSENSVDKVIELQEEFEAADDLAGEIASEYEDVADAFASDYEEAVEEVVDVYEDAVEEFASDYEDAVEQVAAEYEAALEDAMSGLDW